MRRTWTSLGIAGSVAAALIGVSSPAQAATWQYQQSVSMGTAVYPAPVIHALTNNQTGVEYGYGAFDGDGDTFKLRDMLQDSERVAIHWRLSDGSREGICVDAAGKDGDNQKCANNFPEGMKLTFQVGRCDASVNLCDNLGTGWHDWTANKTVTA